MQNFVAAAREALQARNHYAALTLALTLPDSACSLESENGRTDGKKYARWFDQWLSPRYRNFLAGADCYALRCALLHNGVDDIENQRARVALQRFVFTLGAGIHNQLLDNRILQLNVRKFTIDICDAVEAFLASRDLSSNTMVIMDASNGLLIGPGPDGTNQISPSPPMMTIGRMKMLRLGLDPSLDPW